MKKYVILAGVNGAGKKPPDEDIERRYVESLENLKRVLPQCDVASIYDNTDEIRRFAFYKSGECVKHLGKIPEWYGEIQNKFVK